MRIALAGNPNSGKTTMYNRLTGASEQVGNRAGVTVEKKQHLLKKRYAGKAKNIVITDLPGAYSISAYTGEESVTSTYIQQDKPDVILNIVDASNLGRSLFFTSQLLELGIPTVIALNKTDMAESQAIHIDTDLLSEALGCPVVETVSTANRGLKTLIEKALSVAGKPQISPYRPKYIYGGEKGNFADRERYDFVDKIVAEVATDGMEIPTKTKGDALDRILVNPLFGIPLFCVVMFLVFQLSQVWPGGYLADLLAGSLERLKNGVADYFFDANPLLCALLIEGVLGGLVAVVGFLPLVMVMYFLIALLEDCGYLSRVAVVLDPVFKRVGLSGRSVIPFVMAVGCAVPGVMASRTVRDEHERRATILLAPFMPCGAKVPVMALFAGRFFDNSGWVSTLMYFIGIAMIFLGAWIVNLVTDYKTKKSFFIMEMPDYKSPSLMEALKAMLDRGKAYLLKAATVILICNMAVQVMQSFTFGFGLAKTPDESILAGMAQPLAYLLFPILGVLSWQLAAATLTGLIAKENVVGTLAVCLGGIDRFVDFGQLSALQEAGIDTAGMLAVSKIAALAFLIFNLFSPPCMAALAAMYGETKHRGWFFGGVALQLGMGYTLSYLLYTVGTLLVAPKSLHVGGAVGGLVIVASFVTVLTILTAFSKSQKSRKGSKPL